MMIAIRFVSLHSLFDSILGDIQHGGGVEGNPTPELHGVADPLSRSTGTSHTPLAEHFPFGTSPKTSTYG